MGTQLDFDSLDWTNVPIRGGQKAKVQATFSLSHLEAFIVENE